MKQLRNLAVLLILVSLASFSTVFAQQFEIPLAVTDGANSTVLYFGFFPGANLCINPADSLNGHAEAFLPPPPPGGVFDARFVAARAAGALTCYDQGSSVDFRPPNFFVSGKDTFKVFTQIGTGAAVTASWPAGLSAFFTGLTLTYFDGTSNVVVDMRTDISADVTLAVGGILTLRSAGLVVPQPNFAVAPTSVNFGSVGTSSTKLDSVTVSNPGAGTLNITGVASSDPSFTVLPLTATVPALGSAKFFITFAPTAIGPVSGTITFTDNATIPPPPHTVAVSGSGAAAPPSFEFPITVSDGAMRPTTTYPLGFGVFPGASQCVNPADTINGTGESFLPPVPPGGIFDARFVSPGNGRLPACYDQGTLYDYRPFLAFGQKDTFKLLSQMGTGTSLTVAWPGNLNTRYQSATLRFFDGSSNVNVDMLANTSADVTLAVGGVSTIFTTLKTPAPPDTNRQFGMAPTSIPFGGVGVGLIKVDSVTVSNVTGSNPLVISAINSSNARFTVSPAAPQSIASSSSMKFYVTFAPIAVGAQSGTITFVNNGNLAPATTNILNVSGTGNAVPPCFTVVPNPLGFFVPLDSTKIDSVTVTNGDLGTMNITGIVSSSPTVFSISPTTGTIPPSGTMKFYVTAGPVASTQTVTATFTFSLTGTVCTTGILNVSGFFSNVEPQFVTVTPDSMTIITGFFFQRPALRTRAPRLSFPNWSNLLQEVVVQGGFQPGSSESDIAGGMRLGMAFMRPIVTTFGTFYTPRGIRSDTAWVRLTQWIPARGAHPALGSNWGVLQGTLKSRLGFPPVFSTHDSFARGFDSTGNPGDLHRTLLRGQQYQIYPYRTKNKLFAEMVALKFNIAANDLGKAGSEDSYGLFGNLVIHMAGPLDGMSIKAASALVDQYMTFERTIPTSTWFDDAYATVHAINNAFVGPLDTTYLPGPPPGGFFKRGSFYRGNNLHINGIHGASTTGGLLTLGSLRPNALPPTNDLTEGEYGEDVSSPGAPGTGEVSDMQIFQNYPNPFNPTTKIAFSLGNPSQVSVKVYNVLGQEIATLLNNEPMEAGYNSFGFDAHALSTGVYFYVVTGQDLVNGTELPRSIGKMLLIK